MTTIITKEELEGTVEDWIKPKVYDPTTYASDSSSAADDPPPPPPDDEGDSEPEDEGGSEPEDPNP